MSVAGSVHRVFRRALGGTGSVPTPDQLAQNAMRHVAGAALVLLAAAIVHGTGYAEQQWQYVAVAAALVPQVLVDILAVGDPERRTRLRASSRVAPVPLLAALAMATGALVGLVSGVPTAIVAAGLCATAGLAVAASPVSLTIAPRGQRRRTLAREQPVERHA